MKDLSNEAVIHKHHNDLEYLCFRRLEEYPELSHCFTLKPLDFMSSHEAAALHAEERIAEELGIRREALCKPRQTHSCSIRCIRGENPGILSPGLDGVDGLITDQPGIALLLTFADCTPLLFYDPVRRVIADIHSGWRGTLQRIGVKAVEIMQTEYGCDPADIICCIGPHIRKCSFEVDADVRDLFAAEFAGLSEIEDDIDCDKERNKFFIDTLSINRKLLLESGLREESIIDSGLCTVCSADLCHSFRADREASGRSGAIILLK